MEMSLAVVAVLMMLLIAVARSGSAHRIDGEIGCYDRDRWVENFKAILIWIEQLIIYVYI